MSHDNSTIIYTLTDESPLLATASLLPIIRAFTAPVGIRIEKSDISLVKRILASIPDYLAEEQAHGIGEELELASLDEVLEQSVLLLGIPPHQGHLLFQLLFPLPPPLLQFLLESAPGLLLFHLGSSGLGFVVGPRPARYFWSPSRTPTSVLYRPTGT